MQNELISIIVPIYNCERYLRTCLNSILQQTYNNIEIICVYDISADNSLEICKEYAQKDKRVRIIERKKNAGLGECRNTGIENSKGNYIAYVDSDDWVTSDYIDSLYSIIREYDADIAVCSFARTLLWYEGIQLQEDEEIDTYSGREALIKLFEADIYKTDVMLTVAWNKLFKKKTIEGILFPKERIYEDQLYAVKAYYNAQRVVVSNKKIYFYRKNYFSMTMQKYNIRELEELDHYDKMKEFFKKNNEKRLFDMIIARKMPLAINHYVCAKIVDNEEAKKIAVKYIHKDLLNYLRCRLVGIKYKLKLILFVLNRDLFLLYGMDISYREH